MVAQCYGAALCESGIVHGSKSFREGPLAIFRRLEHSRLKHCGCGPATPLCHQTSNTEHLDIPCFTVHPREFTAHFPQGVAALKVPSPSGRGFRRGAICPRPCQAQAHISTPEREHHSAISSLSQAIVIAKEGLPAIITVLRYTALNSRSYDARRSGQNLRMPQPLILIMN